jgi:two-component system, OmpR family, sensor histidine kinase BaeS
MTLSIRTKLFFALVGTGALVALAMLAGLRWSFERGLVELIQGREEARIATIAERLAEVYQRDGGWDGLRRDRRLWVQTLFERPGGPETQSNPPHGPPHGAGLGRWLWGEGQHRQRPDLDGPGAWPPPRALGPDDRPPLPLRLMLLDAGGGIVYGRTRLLAGTRRYPVTLGGTRIGELALLPGPAVADLVEVRFQERFGSALLLIALGVIALGAAVALPFARRLVRPVQGFQDTARRLAAGDLQARVTAAGDDELGRLGHDLNTLAATLESNEQTRRRWAADISHELRTPLALLRAEIEALQDGVRPLDRAALDALHGDTLRLKRLVDDLYDLSLTDLGARGYRKEGTDPAEVLRDDCDSFRPRFAAAGLTLTLDEHLPGPVSIQADPQRLSQLFRNLIGNSLRYTDQGGGLVVILGRAGDRLRIDFQDGPPGVPGEALPRLFERLYRVEGSRSRDTGGAGLGLAIARNICQAHGGRIEARAAPQGGLWIHLELPIP